MEADAPVIHMTTTSAKKQKNSAKRALLQTIRWLFAFQQVKDNSMYLPYISQLSVANSSLTRRMQVRPSRSR